MKAAFLTALVFVASISTNAFSAEEGQSTIGKSLNLESKVLKNTNNAQEAKDACDKISPNQSWRLPKSFKEIFVAANDNTQEATKIPELTPSTRNTYLLWVENLQQQKVSLAAYTDGPDSGNAEELPEDISTLLDEQLNHSGIPANQRSVLVQMKQIINKGPVVICVKDARRKIK